MRSPPCTNIHDLSDRRNICITHFKILKRCNVIQCVISGIHHEVEEIYALLGYYGPYSGNSLPMFRYNLSVPSSKVNKSKKKSMCRIWWWFAIRCRTVGNGVFWSLQGRGKESNVRNFVLLIWNLSNFWMWCRVASPYRWTRHDFRLPLLSRWNLPPSGILCSI